MSDENRETTMLAGLAEAQSSSLLQKKEKDVLPAVLENVQQCVEDAKTLILSDDKRKIVLPSDALQEVEAELSAHLRRYYETNPEVSSHDLKLEAERFAHREVLALVANQSEQKRKKRTRIIAMITAAVSLFALVYLLFIPKAVSDYALSAESDVDSASITSTVSDRRLTIAYAPVAMKDTKFVQRVEMKGGAAVIRELAPETQYLFWVKGGSKAQNHQVTRFTKEAVVEQELFQGNLYMVPADRQAPENFSEWEYVSDQVLKLQTDAISASGAYIMTMSAYSKHEIDPDAIAQLYLIAPDGVCAVEAQFSCKEIILDAYTLVIPMEDLCEQLRSLGGIWPDGTAKFICRCGDQYPFKQSVEIKIIESEVSIQ